MLDRILSCKKCHIVIISILVLLAYANTYDVPFQWDDRILIEDSHLVDDIEHYLSPSDHKEDDNYGLFRRRPLAFLTFSLNHWLHEHEVMGYHIFNNLLHLLNAILLYLIVVLLFKSPGLVKSKLAAHSAIIALICALVFALHPIQTEAVTYILQRFASLCAMLYLGAICFYLMFRISGRRYLFVLTFLLTVLAMKTKEIAVTLPIMIAMIELMFFQASIKSRLKILAPIFLTLIILPFSLIESGMPINAIVSPGTAHECDFDEQGEILCTHGGFDADYLSPAYSRGDYFKTQLNVIVKYMGLMIYPRHQNIVHDIQLQTSFLSKTVLLSKSIIILVMILARFLFKQSCKGEPALCLAAAGIMWFFVTLSVESSIIPIPMLMSEYRLYLPSVGFIIAGVTLAAHVITMLPSRRLVVSAAIIMTIIVPLTFASATYARNTVWQNRTTLWQDAVSKSPNSARSHYNLCIAYEDSMQNHDAIRHCKKTVELMPEYHPAHVSLGMAYADIGLFDNAISHLNKALVIKPGDARVHNNMCIAYSGMGEHETGMVHCQTALEFDPDHMEARFNLGLGYLQLGSTGRALSEFQRVLAVEPNFAQARLFFDHYSKKSIN